MNYLSRLRDIRLQKNMTQKDMANLLNIGVRSYQKYELGEREPSYDKLNFIADYFGVSIDYIFQRTDNPEINR